MYKRQLNKTAVAVVADTVEIVAVAAVAVIAVVVVAVIAVAADATTKAVGKNLFLPDFTKAHHFGGLFLGFKSNPLNSQKRPCHQHQRQTSIVVLQKMRP